MVESVVSVGARSAFHQASVGYANSDTSTAMFCGVRSTYCCCSHCCGRTDFFLLEPSDALGPGILSKRDKPDPLPLGWCPSRLYAAGLAAWRWNVGWSFPQPAVRFDAAACPRSSEVPLDGGNRLTKGLFTRVKSFISEPGTSRCCDFEASERRPW